MRKFLCLILLQCFIGAAYGQGFQAKTLAERMDEYAIGIPNTHTYIRHCGHSYLSGGLEACTIHNAGPYFIQLVVPSQSQAQLRLRLVVGQGYGKNAFTKYAGPALLAFLMAVTDSREGGLYLLKRMSQHIYKTRSTWKNITVTQIPGPHTYIWKAELMN